jgi:MFS family permease
MTAQAFLFNAVFFSYGLVLTTFHGVSEQSTGLYLLPLAASNFFGPVLLSPLFDIVGRRAMIAGTYAASGVLLLLTAVLLGFDVLTAWTQTLAWMVIFFFASAAASSAYLTASEIFPLEARALAIAIFYAIGTAIGGAVGPALFGYLVGSGVIIAVAGGYAVASVLMLIAAAAELRFGVDAERRSLESIAPPLSVA